MPRIVHVAAATVPGAYGDVVWQLAVVDESSLPAPGSERSPRLRSICVAHDAPLTALRGTARDVYQDTYDPAAALTREEAADWAEDLLRGKTVVEITGMFGKCGTLPFAQRLPGPWLTPCWVGPPLDVCSVAAGFVQGAIFDGGWALDKDERRLLDVAAAPPYVPAALSPLLGVATPSDQAQLTAGGLAWWTYGLWKAAHGQAPPFDEVSMYRVECALRKAGRLA